MNRTTACLALALALTFAALPAAVRAATWYTNSSTGLDTNTGQSPDAPLQFVQTAVTRAGFGDTINVIENGNAQTLIIDKSLTVQGWVAGGNNIPAPNAYPLMQSQASGTPAVQITSPGVTMRYLRVQGVTGGSGVLIQNTAVVTVESCRITGNQVGVWIDNATQITLRDCTIDSNPLLGVSVQGGEFVSIHGDTSSSITNNGMGVSLFNTANCDITGNILMAGNVTGGVRVYNSRGCFLRGVNFGSGTFGVKIDGTSYGNTVAFNTFGPMLNSGTSITQDGLLLDGSGGNCVSGNTFDGFTTDRAIRIVNASGNMISANTFTSNAQELHLSNTPAQRNHVFWNVFAGAIYADQAGHTLRAPVKLHVSSTTKGAKQAYGNTYLTPPGTDSNSDGIIDTAFTSPDGRVSDPYPLAAALNLFPERYSNWQLDQNSMTPSLPSDSLGAVYIVSGGPKQFTAQGPFGSNLTYPPGVASSQPALASTWSGWLSFAEPPANGQAITLTLGHSASDGSNFTPVMATTVTGDGASRFYPYSMPAKVMSVATGRRVALQIQHGGDTVILRVGATWSVLSAPYGRGGFAPGPMLLLQ